MAYLENSTGPGAKTPKRTGHRLKGERTRRADNPKVYALSRLSKQPHMLPGITDERCLAYRRFRDIARAILVDQNAELCSEARIQLIRRFAAAAVSAEQMESRLINGEEINITEHALLVSSLVRIANKIGLDRVAKNVPDLDQLLAKINNKSQANGEGPDIISAHAEPDMSGQNGHSCGDAKAKMADAFDAEPDGDNAQASGRAEPPARND